MAPQLTLRAGVSFRTLLLAYPSTGPGSSGGHVKFRSISVCQLPAKACQLTLHTGVSLITVHQAYQLYKTGISSARIGQLTFPCWCQLFPQAP